MNRREMLQAGLSVLTAAGIDGEIQTVTPKNPQMFAITSPTRLSLYQRDQLLRAWKDAFEGSPIAQTKVLILEGGMQIQVVDKE